MARQQGGRRWGGARRSASTARSQAGPHRCFEMQSCRRSAAKSNAAMSFTRRTTASGGASLGWPEGEARVRIGQLEGRARFLLDGGMMSDGTPDRYLQTWLIRARSGTKLMLTASHQRAGTVSTTITLG